MAAAAEVKEASQLARNGCDNNGSPPETGNNIFKLKVRITGPRNAADADAGDDTTVVTTADNNAAAAAATVVSSTTQQHLDKTNATNCASSPQHMEQGEQESADDPDMIRQAESLAEDPDEIQRAASILQSMENKENMQNNK